jgi:hypothetical protein
MGKFDPSNEQIWDKEHLFHSWPNKLRSVSGVLDKYPIIKTVLVKSVAKLKTSLSAHNHVQIRAFLDILSSFNSKPKILDKWLNS